MTDPLIETKDNQSPNIDNTLIWFREWIYEGMGIHYPDAKMPLLLQRLQGLCVKLELNDIKQLKSAVEKGSIKDIYHRMANLATTNHTHFYREMSVLNFFIQHIVPTLPEGQQWRIWSAASSSGEELYTLTLMLINQFGLDIFRQRVRLLGTDINPYMIEKAEKGIYPINRLDGIDQKTRTRWFKQIAMDHWQINQVIRDNCVFRRFNLKSYPWPFAQLFHVTFLRNILYYFDTANQQTILKRIYDVTVPGGWLVTSVTEPMIELDVAWQRIDAGVYRKV